MPLEAQVAEARPAEPAVPIPRWLIDGDVVLLARSLVFDFLFLLRIGWIDGELDRLI